MEAGPDGDVAATISVEGEAAARAAAAITAVMAAVLLGLMTLMRMRGIPARGSTVSA